MIKTRDFNMVRGQTKTMLFVVRDYRGQKVDLTGATAYLWMRADQKVDASVKLASAVTADHRVGIVIAADQTTNTGEFTATFIPADTASLVALGADDPWVYDAWIKDSTGQKFPVVAMSRIPLYPEITTVP